MTSFWHKNKKCQILKLWGDFYLSSTLVKMFWVGWGDAPRGVVDRGGRIGYGARQLFFLEFLKLFDKKFFFIEICRICSKVFLYKMVILGWWGLVGPITGCRFEAKKQLKFDIRWRHKDESKTRKPKWRKKCLEFGRKWNFIFFWDRPRMGQQ